jgi:hypothetical protein
MSKLHVAIPPDFSGKAEVVLYGLMDAMVSSILSPTELWFLSLPVKRFYKILNTMSFTNFVLLFSIVGTQ